MEDLYSLIHSLTCGEWQSLQNYFTCFTAHDGSRLKYLQLAKLLMNAEECPSDKKCCLKIYGVKSDLSFEKLKSRLKDKILDFLSTDICDKRKNLDEVDFAYIQIKKMSAQYQQLYYSKPRLKLVYKLVDEIIELAKKYEYFSAVVEHLKLKRGFASWQNGNSEFERLNKEIEEYIFSSSLLIKTEYYYQGLSILYDFSGILPAKPRDGLC